jgi:hypothetical protein
MSNVLTTQRLYWLATGLFSLLFIGSSILGFADPQGAYDEYRHLEFPSWILYPLSLLKALGVVAIISNKSQTLKDFAFAGFLYDLLLAIGGHLAQMDVKIWLAIFGLVLWGFAFYMDRIYLPLVRQKITPSKVG